MQYTVGVGRDVGFDFFVAECTTRARNTITMIAMIAPAIAISVLIDKAGVAVVIVLVSLFVLVAVEVRVVRCELMTVMMVDVLVIVCVTVLPLFTEVIVNIPVAKLKSRSDRRSNSDYFCMRE